MKFLTVFMNELEGSFESLSKEQRDNMWLALDDMDEKILKLSEDAKKELNIAYEKKDPALLKDAEAYDLYSDILNLVNKIKEEAKMTDKNWWILQMKNLADVICSSIMPVLHRQKDWIFLKQLRKVMTGL